jgi:hypothetical protein
MITVIIQRYLGYKTGIKKFCGFGPKLGEIFQVFYV